jgi:hypothetical protein
MGSPRAVTADSSAPSNFARSRLYFSRRLFWTPFSRQTARCAKADCDRSRWSAPRMPVAGDARSRVDLPARRPAASAFADAKIHVIHKRDEHERPHSRFWPFRSRSPRAPRRRSPARSARPRPSSWRTWPRSTLGRRSTPPMGFGSLFGYCTEVSRLSEDATCNRIYAARACRRFPVILDALASGALSLTSVRLLNPAPHGRKPSGGARRGGRPKAARHRGADRAELAPRPDVPSTVRQAARAHARYVFVADARPANGGLWPACACRGTYPATQSPARSSRRPRRSGTASSSPSAGRATTPCAACRDLLRREIPNGDPGAIVARALTLLLEKVEKAKRGAAARPRTIRSGTDSRVRTPIVPSRDIPAHCQREVGGATETNALTLRPMGGDARSAASWSSITSVPFAHGWDRQPSRTSRFVAGATTSTRPSWCS